MESWDNLHLYQTECENPHYYEFQDSGEIMISEKPVLSGFSIENFPNTSKGLQLDIDVRRLSSVIIRILLNVISVIFWFEYSHFWV